MTIHSQTIQPNIAIWIGKRPRLISKRLGRRIFKVLMILILALAIFLIATQPVMAVPSPFAG